MTETHIELSIARIIRALETQEQLLKSIEETLKELAHRDR